MKKSFHIGPHRATEPFYKSYITYIRVTKSKSSTDAFERLALQDPLFSKIYQKEKEAYARNQDRNNRPINDFITKVEDDLRHV